MGHLAFVTTMTAHAQVAPLPLWELGVFAGTATTPAYPGSSDRATRSLAVPVRAVLEFNNGVRQQGYAFEPELSVEVRDAGAGWNLFATVGRPAFDAKAGL